MRLFNKSHINRHVDSLDYGRNVMSFINNRLPSISKYAILKHQSKSRTDYFVNMKVNHFDITDVLNNIRGHRDTFTARGVDYPYQDYLDIFMKVYDDMKAYGNSIPDTSDVWDESMIVKKVRKYDQSKSRLKQREQKAVNRREFSKKFKQAMGW